MEENDFTWESLLDDPNCAVCVSAGTTESNKIIICDGCGIGVHQYCYGVPDLPPESESWICDVCKVKTQISFLPQCILCLEYRHGAFKRVDNDAWIHVFCGLVCPEIKFRNFRLISQPTGFESFLLASRRVKNCFLCKKKGGFVVSCSHKTCYVQFHPCCGQRRGYLFDFRAPSGTKLAFCKDHEEYYVRAMGHTVVSNLASHMNGGENEPTVDVAKNSQSNGSTEANVVSEKTPPEKVKSRSDSKAGSTRAEANISCLEVWPLVEMLPKPLSEEVIKAIFSEELGKLRGDEAPRDAIVDLIALIDKEVKPIEETVLRNEQVKEISGKEAESVCVFELNGLKKARRKVAKTPVSVHDKRLDFFLRMDAETGNLYQPGKQIDASEPMPNNLLSLTSSSHEGNLGGSDSEIWSIFNRYKSLSERNQSALACLKEYVLQDSKSIFVLQKLVDEVLKDPKATTG